MRKEATFLGSLDIAKRTNVINSRYRTQDGRFILSEADIRKLFYSMTPEEYVNGLDIEQITDEKAQELIKLNNYQLGYESK